MLINLDGAHLCKLRSRISPRAFEFIARCDPNSGVDSAAVGIPDQPGNKPDLPLHAYNGLSIGGSVLAEHAWTQCVIACLGGQTHGSRGKTPQGSLCPTAVCELVRS